MVVSENFILINTHLYNPISASGKEITKNQFNILRKMKENIIISGDLNLSEDEFINVNKGHFKYKKTEQYTFPSKKEFLKYQYKNLDSRRTKTDYIIGKNHLKEEIIKSPIISDHFPILVTLKKNELEHFFSI